MCGKTACTVRRGGAGNGAQATAPAPHPTTAFAEIAHPDYPGERLIACRNPALAAERARKRQDLLQATEKELAHIAERVGKGTLSGADKIGIAVGKVSGKFKVGKHFHLTITDTGFEYHRDQAAIDAQAALDGIYVLRTSVDADALDPTAVVDSYKKLANVERDFRIIKSDDLDLRPIHHRLGDRVKTHVLICMLACYLIWHLRKAWAPLTFTDEAPPHRDNPVAPARRSTAAEAKASTKHDADGNPVRNLRDLLDHLATLTRDRIRYHDTDIEIDKLTDATPEQRLRTHRRPHPTHHRRVARTTTHRNQRIPRSTRAFAYFNSLNFGLVHRGLRGLTRRSLVSTLKQSPERRRYGCDSDDVFGDRAGYQRHTELNRPRFYAHFLCWEGWRDVDQVRREHQGQGGAAGPRTPRGLRLGVGGDQGDLGPAGDEPGDAAQVGAPGRDRRR